MDADVGRLTNSIVYPSKLIIYTMFFPLFTAVHEYFFSSSTELPAVIHSRQKKANKKILTWELSWQYNLSRCTKM